MRVLQRAVWFKAAIAAGALLSAGFPAAAEDQRQPLFSCGTDPVEDHGYLWLTGVEADFADWRDLRFERIADITGDTIYSYPPPGVDPRTAFYFSHSDGAEGYLVSIRWQDGGRDYVYYSLAIPPDSEVEDDMGGGDAGLAISEGGRLIERAGCAERPYMFISYMREAMSCDAANRYGEAACGDSSFERVDPINLDLIGLVSQP